MFEKLLFVEYTASFLIYIPETVKYMGIIILKNSKNQRPLQNSKNQRPLQWYYQELISLG